MVRADWVKVQILHCHRLKIMLSNTRNNWILKISVGSVDRWRLIWSQRADQGFKEKIGYTIAEKAKNPKLTAKDTVAALEARHHVRLAVRMVQYIWQRYGVLKKLNRAEIEAFERHHRRPAQAFEPIAQRSFFEPLHAAQHLGAHKKSHQVIKRLLSLMVNWSR